MVPGPWYFRSLIASPELHGVAPPLLRWVDFTLNTALFLGKPLSCPHLYAARRAFRQVSAVPVLDAKES